jgi:Short C-terminal domain
MFMRRRPLLRAAAIGGGAYVAGKRSAQRAADQTQQEDEQNERLASQEQQAQGQRQPGGDAPAPGGQGKKADGHAPSMLDQLNQLTALRQQGALTDSEFSAAKAKLLGT